MSVLVQGGNNPQVLFAEGVVHGRLALLVFCTGGKGPNGSPADGKGERGLRGAAPIAPAARLDGGALSTPKVAGQVRGVLLPYLGLLEEGGGLVNDEPGLGGQRFELQLVCAGVCLVCDEDGHLAHLLPDASPPRGPSGARAGYRRWVSRSFRSCLSRLTPRRRPRPPRSWRTGR